MKGELRFRLRILDHEMTRYEPEVEKRKSNFKFWSKEYREREPKKPTALAPLSGNRAGL
jgi:hypothetical protein